MQRPIKFRAWDRLNKKIVTSGLSINIDTTDRVVPVSFTQGDIAYCRDNDVNSVPNIHSDIELMQYTNLKDKNGVEIYEGDIVKKGDGLNYEVRWSGAAFGFRNVMWNNRCEVIGNIWENPELLKESKDE